MEKDDKKYNNKISQAWASDGKASVNCISLLIYDSLDFRFFAWITAPLDVSRNYKMSKYLAKSDSMGCLLVNRVCSDWKLRMNLWIHLDDYFVHCVLLI